MSLPAGWVPVPLNPDGGLPQAAPLPVPDGDLTLVLACVAADLACVLSAAPDRQVWTSDDQLVRRLAPEVGPGDGANPVDPQDFRDVASSTALVAFTRPPGQTLSADEARVVIMVLAGQRVVACQPALTGRGLAVSDGSRMRGHAWVDEVTVTAGSLVGARPTGTRLAVGWRTLSASTRTRADVSPEDAEAPYVALV